MEINPKNKLSLWSKVSKVIRNKKIVERGYCTLFEHLRYDFVLSFWENMLSKSPAAASVFWGKMEVFDNYQYQEK